MALDKNQIELDLKSALSEIANTKNFDSLKQVKIDHLGDKSPLARANQSLGSLDAKDRNSLVMPDRK